MIGRSGFNSFVELHFSFQTTALQLLCLTLGSKEVELIKPASLLVSLTEALKRQTSGVAELFSAAVAKSD